MENTIEKTEVLVDAIVNDKNTLAEEFLQKILASKVDNRYDEVMENNG